MCPGLLLLLLLLVHPGALVVACAYPLLLVVLLLPLRVPLVLPPGRPLGPPHPPRSLFAFDFKTRPPRSSPSFAGGQKIISKSSHKTKKAQHNRTQGRPKGLAQNRTPDRGGENQMTTKTTTKTAAVKTKTAAAKTTTKKAPAVKAVKTNDITAFILAEVSKRIGSKFYKRALSYHAEAGTVFPRARTAAARASLTQADVEETMRQHDAFVLAPGNAKGQAIFDVYMTHKG